jgi:hypothetical protein
VFLTFSSAVNIKSITSSSLEIWVFDAATSPPSSPKSVLTFKQPLSVFPAQPSDWLSAAAVVVVIGDENLASLQRSASLLDPNNQVFIGVHDIVSASGLVISSTY